MKRLWGRRRRSDADLDDEIAAHFNMAVADRLERGQTREEAEHAACVEFGNVTRTKEAVREVWGRRLIDELITDVRYACRTLSRAPAFAVAAVLTLALGIGISTLVFSIVNGVLLRPLPIPDPTRLVFVERVVDADGIATRPYAYGEYRESQARNLTLEGLAGFTQFPVAFETSTGVSREMPAFVTGNYFEVLGVRPFLGRLLTPDDDHDGAAAVVVLDYDFWTGAFHRDRTILGSSIRLTAGRAAAGLADRPFTVVGIAPQGFHGLDQSVRLPAWMPLHSMMPEARLVSRQPGPTLVMFGRLKPGVSREAARGNFAMIAGDLAREYSRADSHARVLIRNDVGWMRNWPVLREFASAMLVLAGFVLLAACASVATGLTVRTIDRHREIGIRLSLGASRFRVVRLVLIEVLVIAAVSGLLAITIVSGTTPMVSHLVVPSDPPIQVDVHPDATVFLLATAVSILGSAIAATAAARAIAGIDPNQALKGLGGLLSTRRWTARDVLTGAQVVFSCVLMAACVLSLVGLRRALAVSLGFDVDRVATVTMDFDVAKYSREQQRMFMERAIEEVRRLPGVEAATYVGGLPLGLARNLVYAVPAGQPLDASDAPLPLYPITADYFRTMGVRVLEGRELNVQDTGKAVVNEAFVHQILQSNRAVGVRVSLGNVYFRSATNQSLEIAGVVADGRYLSLSESHQPAIFTPLYDTPFGRPTMAVRTLGRPAALAVTVRRTIAALDPELPMRNVGSASELIAPAFLANRAAAALLTVFGIVALLLAIASIHAVVSYAVSKRRREISVRVALGAARARVVGLVAGRVLAVSAAGIVVGVLATLALRRVLQQIVYQASSDEPVVLGGVTVVMLFAIAIALVVPAIRSVRIEPMEALRVE
jgi:predicted permease